VLYSRFAEWRGKFKLMQRINWAGCLQFCWAKIVHRQKYLLSYFWRAFWACRQDWMGIVMVVWQSTKDFDGTRLGLRKHFLALPGWKRRKGNLRWLINVLRALIKCGRSVPGRLFPTQNLCVGKRGKLYWLRRSTFIQLANQACRDYVNSEGSALRFRNHWMERTGKVNKL